MKKNIHGSTALHLTATQDQPEAAQVLLNNGANINEKDNFGCTALDLAIKNFCEEIAKSLIKHEIKLKGSEVQKPDYLTEYTEISEYWDKCLDEVIKMKEEKIHQGITFYDILISKNRKLASYIRNKKVEERLEGGDYKIKFPIHTNDIDYLFKTGKQRLEALNVGEIVVKYFDGLSLPRELYPMIVECLSNEDLKNVRKAGIQTMDEKKIPQSLGSDVSVEPEDLKNVRKAGIQTMDEEKIPQSLGSDVSIEPEDLKNVRKAGIQTMDEEKIPQSLGSDVSVEPIAKRSKTSSGAKGKGNLCCSII